MRRPKDFQNHECCPADWKKTPNMTGSHELDATIIRMKNKDMADRLRDHISCDATAYNHRTGYNSSSRD